MSGESLLCIKNFSAGYANRKRVIGGELLEVKSGATIGLIGANGAGKSTLIKGICGLLHQWQAEKFVVDGKVSGPEDPIFRQVRCVVFAEDTSFPRWTFDKLVDFYGAAFRQKVDDGDLRRLLKGFNFEKFRNVPLADLSSGNRKKARLICALLMRRKLLILDEPTDFLDFMGTEYLYTCINAYRKAGNSVILSSHIAESLTRCSDRLYLLKEGVVSGPLSVPEDPREVVGLVD